METLSQIIQKLSDLAPILYALSLVVPLIGHFYLMLLKRRLEREMGLTRKADAILEHVRAHDDEHRSTTAKMREQLKELQIETVEQMQECDNAAELAQLKALLSQLESSAQRLDAMEIKKQELDKKKERMSELTVNLKGRVKKKERLLSRFDFITSKNIIAALEIFMEYLTNSTTLSKGDETTKSPKARAK